MIGKTISLAGSANKNESNITPSKPSNLENGSKKLDKIIKSEFSFILIFESIHIIKPAGIETSMAFFNIDNDL